MRIVDLKQDKNANNWEMILKYGKSLKQEINLL